MSNSKFDKVLGTKDILVIAFGAMIGWGWVINSGDWITSAGFLGAIIAFLLGGTMVIFVGLTYAELTAAMPQCGGEHVFSYKAMGPNGSFVCTWAIILGYVATAAFEAAALPTVFKYIFGDGFMVGHMYNVGDTPIYASYVAVGCIVSVIITLINIRGAKTAAILQTILTSIIAVAGLLLIAASVVRGDTANITSNLFHVSNTGSSLKTAFGGILTVTCMTPFLFIGFDVIPQAAEEINIAYKKIGKIMLFSIGLAVTWYLLIIFAVAYVMPKNEMLDSLNNGLVTADAMAYAFNSSAMANVLIISGICGILTSWNSFLIGGSRAMYSIAESKMMPAIFAKLHSKYKTPVAAIVLVGVACFFAPFFGKPVLIWLVDAASFGCCIAYLMVSISFVILRKKAPEMERPYKVKHGKFVGCVAIILSGILSLLYIIPVPFAASALIWQEWVVVGVWILLGFFFFLYSKKKYGNEFGIHVDVSLDENLK
ncbi:APC family permease [Anaeromicropila populeti]|uniref:Amino acid permease n=1 Tax=Anaeromicropila populeti TaxID=37658 RepID=A0A1I6LPA7_9FIRM|nr:APC family permease [Anaeromicropila populeti]SFS05092.1 Amino acid permease [Anaeromicropila populeti]